MFGKVKRFLGIEGVKIDIEVPEIIPLRQGVIEGQLAFVSMHEQEVKRVKVKLIEKYYRGRRKQKLINEFVIGEETLEQSVLIKPNEEVKISFSLPYELVKSDMDRWEDQNFLFGGLVKTAKLIKGVRSVFRIEAEAEVKGTALNPVAKKEVKLK